MKETLFSIVFFCISVAGFGQIKLNRAVGVGTRATNPSSLLSVNGNGRSNAILYLSRSGSGGGEIFGIDIEAEPSPSTAFGLRSICPNPSTPAMPGAFCGILGQAGGFQTGRNMGVLGVLTGDYNGSAVVGRLGAYGIIPIPGRYAGYFEGNVKVTGTIDGTLISGSDVRYKKNIVELGTQQLSRKIFDLNPIEYNLEQQYSEDGYGEKVALLDEKSQVFTKKHYGLIAQELKEIYPDLVYEKDNGYLAVNYVELIPILIQSMKEMNERISFLEKEKSLFRNAETNNNISTENQTAILYQNTPNPFMQSTEIKYYLPQSVHIAYLCIYDLQGKLLKQINIAQRGEGVETISATEFPAGIYLYGLIADGKEVDIKRMILTK